MRLRSHSSSSDRQSTAKKVAPSCRSSTSSSSSSLNARRSVASSRRTTTSASSSRRSGAASRNTTNSSTSTSGRSAVSSPNTTPSPSSSTRQSAAEQVAPSSIIKSANTTKSTWTWGSLKNPTHASDGSRLISSSDFALTFGLGGVEALYSKTSMMWPDGSDDQAPRMPVSDEVKAVGARLCTASAAEFDSLEKIISEKAPYIEFRLIPRGADGKLDREWIAEYDNARLQRHEANPGSLGLVLRQNKPFKYNDYTIQPYDTYTVYDRDLETPAMILHLPSCLTFSALSGPPGSEGDPTGLQVEVALQMKLKAKLSFQGVSFDGVRAIVCLDRVTRQSDILASHKTHLGSALYLLPSRREAFVAHMVQLLRNHTDLRETYRFSHQTSRWNPRKGPAGDFVEC